jgi:uncharacterized membrane protein YkvA (DUF1232 family)
MEDYIDFEEQFNKLINNHKGDSNYELIKDYPLIFSTVTRISSDKNTDGIAKMIMNCAIAYFILPEDIVSEKDVGIKGYMDDFFLCIHALRQLLDYDKNMGKYLIKKHWRLNDNYEDYLPKKYYELTKKIEPQVISNVLSLSGLNCIYDIVLSRNNPRAYLEMKTRDFQKKIDYMFYLFFNHTQSSMNKEEKKNFENQFFGTPEFWDFVKKLDSLAQSDEKYSQPQEKLNEILDLNTRLTQAKAKRLLK